MISGAAENKYPTWLEWADVSALKVVTVKPFLLEEVESEGSAKKCDVVMEEEQEDGRKGTRGNFYNNHTELLPAEQSVAQVSESYV